MDAGPLLAPGSTPSPEYADFAARNGQRYVAGGKVHAGGSAPSAGPAAPRTRPMPMRQPLLAPHIGRASLLGAEFRRRQLAQAFSMEALDALEWPVYVVGRDGRVLLSNRAGANPSRPGHAVRHPIRALALP